MQEHRALAIAVELDDRGVDCRLEDSGPHGSAASR